MTKYRTTQYVHEDGTKYVFVTRGKSEPVTNEEIIEYIKRETPTIDRGNLPQVVQPRSTAKDVAEGLARQFLANGQFEDTGPQMCTKTGEFSIPEEREKIFLADLKRGIPFCERKYGVKEPALVAEAKRIYPSLNLVKLLEKKDGTQGKAS